MNALFSLVVIIATAEAASAQPVTIHGWIDAYYAWNQQHAESHVNFFSGTGTSAHRAGEVALNAAADHGRPVGFHLTLVAGDSTDVEVRRDHSTGTPFNGSPSQTLAIASGVVFF